MYGVVLLVVVALVSLLVTRIATIALTATGMSHSAARFQARSALTGVGFTTTEAESVVNHPARRRVAMVLMLVGNLGLVTAIAALLSGILSTDNAGQAAVRAAILIGGLAVVYGLSLSKGVDRRLSRLISRVLSRYTDLDLRDYASLLHVSGPYAVNELKAREGDWLSSKTLGELRLMDEGIVVLGIIRADGDYVGAPGKDTRIEPGDIVVLYGRATAIAELDNRMAGDAGDQAHRSGAEAHRRSADGSPQPSE